MSHPAKWYFISIFSILFLSSAAQESEENPWYEKGRVYGRIFANLHKGLAETDVKAFEMKRAYLGYQADIDEHWSGDIKLDIGNQNDVQDYAAKKRFAYFKNAYVQYRHQSLRIQFGIADCYQFKLQEGFWGYRYISQSLQDQQSFGSSADLGMFIRYQWNDKLHTDLSVSNGEGYTNIQQDDYFKLACGVTYRPVSFLILRTYVDYNDSDESAQYSIATFLGIETRHFTLGNEYNYQANTDYASNQNRTGLSFYTTLKLPHNIAVFGRFDYLSSNILPNDKIPWNLADDGSGMIIGCEYTWNKHLRTAFTYDDWIAYAQNGTDEHYLFFNVELNF